MTNFIKIANYKFSFKLTIQNFVLNVWRKALEITENKLFVETIIVVIAAFSAKIEIGEILLPVSCYSVSPYLKPKTLSQVDILNLKWIFAIFFIDALKSQVRYGDRFLFIFSKFLNLDRPKKYNNRTDLKNIH